LDIKTQIVFDDPHLTYSNSTDRLIRICRDNHATTYLSGPSGSKYLDFGLFEKALIKKFLPTVNLLRKEYLGLEEISHKQALEIKRAAPLIQGFSRHVFKRLYLA
jgi:hypothetical protein